MAGRSKGDSNFWCYPQHGGHPTLYFHGHTLISRADYVSAVGPDDCDPHIATGPRGRRKRRAPALVTERQQLPRM
jgi:hypothetical protein